MSLFYSLDEFEPNQIYKNRRYESLFVRMTEHGDYEHYSERNNCWEDMQLNVDYLNKDYIKINLDNECDFKTRYFLETQGKEIEKIINSIKNVYDQAREQKLVEHTRKFKEITDVLEVMIEI